MANNISEDPREQLVLLVDLVLEWWEDHKYDSYPLGDGEWDNIYSETPEFCYLAEKIKNGSIVVD